MKKWIKVSLYTAFFSLAGYGISCACDSQTKGFRKSDITSAFPFDLRWEPNGSASLESSSEIRRVLTSPFYFLARGGSAYVFISEDQKYVLKLFQAERLSAPSWSSSKMISFFIPSLTQKILNKRNSQKTLQFSSYKMALDTLPHQTGAVYLHLNPTSHHKTQITLYDNIGIKHLISADETAFVLQKKADRFATYFKHLLEKNDLAEAKRLLSDFAFFLKERAVKGIRDGDITPRFNLGIIDKSLVFYDIDQLRTNHLESTPLKHMMKDANEMFLWLEKKNSDLIIFLKEEIQRLSSEITTNEQ